MGMTDIKVTVRKENIKKWREMEWCWYIIEMTNDESKTIHDGEKNQMYYSQRLSLM